MKKITFLNAKMVPQFLVLICLLFFNGLQAQTYTTVAALQTAVNAAASTGGTFILKDNTYSNASFSFTSIKATSDKPIIIKSETVGGVILTNDSKFTLNKCSNITVEGFNMNCTGKNSLVKLSGCSYIRFTRNTFKLTISDGTSSVKWFYIGGIYDDIVYPYVDPSHHNRIDHNIFQDKNLPGHYITVDGNNGKDQSQYDRIDHNYFKNNGPRAVNEQESIRVGWSDMSKSSGFTTVEYNLFENCDGDPEIVSVKSCDNIVRHNTFKGCYGSVGLRHGNRNRIEGNYFFGNGRAISTSPDGATLYTGGVRIYGTDHVVINNYFEGLTGTRWDAPITLTQGDVIDGQSTSLSSHFRAERVMIAYNTLVNNDQGIEIGFSNSAKYGKSLANITIANNLITSSKNSLVTILDGKDQGSNITWSRNLFYPTGTATTVTGGTTTTSFTTAQAVNENPNLIFDNATSTWRSSATTPLYANTLNTVNTTPSELNEDIEGKSRPSTSNPGAHHFSMESVRYMPMTTATVGPLAYEDIPLALSPVTSFALAGEAKTTTVTTALAWTATVDSSWLSINNSSGTGNGSISITVVANTTGVERTGLLTVTGAGATPVTLAITQVGPTLTLSAVTNFIAGGEAKATTVTADVAWTASIDNNSSWLSINTTSGTKNGSINITATANTLTTTRTGTLTVIGGGLTKTLTITQNGVPSGAVLINTGTNGNPVSVTATSEQLSGSNTNYAINTLDKTAAKWSDNADGGILTFDLGGIYTLESIKISTTGTSSKSYNFGIQTSTDGINYTAITSVVSDLGTALKTFPISDVAKFVKIIGQGNSSGNGYATITEIEFWGTAGILSINKNELNNAFTVYPNPVSNTLYLQSSLTNATKGLVYSMDCKEVLNEKLNASGETLYSMDVSKLQNGIYLLKIVNKSGTVLGTNRIVVKK